MGVCDSTSHNHNHRSKSANTSPREQKDTTDYIVSSKFATHDDLTKYYTISSEFLGKGASGIVSEGTDSNGNKYAIKRVNKFTIKDKNCIRTEAKISQTIHHENIVKCHGVYEDLKMVSFVLELIEGGDLYFFITKAPGGHLSDQDSLDLIIQILHTLNYLHNEAHICHRDIKPENFLIQIENSTPKIKLIDFGLSCYIPEDHFMYDYLGSPLYMAPEIAEGQKYSKMIDLWSTGVLFYNMLTGCQPFSSKDRETTADEIVSAPIDFKLIENEELRELCMGLMERLPDFRLSAVRALEKALKIRNEAINLELDDEQIQKMREMFNKIDNDKKGYLTIEQLNEYYRVETKETYNIVTFSDFSYLVQNNTIVHY